MNQWTKPVITEIDLTLTETEFDKYHKIWTEVPKYREYSPGEQFLILWNKVVKPESNSSVIDFGAGTGRASLLMAMTGHKVLMLDLVPECLDDFVRDALAHNEGLRFDSCCLWDEGIAARYDHARYGYCCDVMEHIPPERVEQVISNILSLVDECFFMICLQPDHFGESIGESLHLTVQPFVWWRDLFKKHWNIIECRDMFQYALIRASLKE